MSTKKPLQKPLLRTGIVINPSPRQQSLAAGYWGAKSPKSMMLATQVVERIIKSNSDWVKMGVISDVWVPPLENIGKLPICGCVKTTNQTADVRCQKCYGTKFIPGFVKWGYNTSFFSAVASGFTGQPDAGFELPTSIVKNVATSLHTLQLAPGVISSSFQTSDFAVYNPYNTDWELEALVYNRAPGNSYLVEWSLDRGANWFSGDFKTLQLSRGDIRFRVTMSRLNSNSPSPQFEILRFRHPCQDQPWIRIAKPMGSRKKKREVFGNVTDESGLKFITIPLQGQAQINGEVVYSKVWLPDEGSSFFFEVKEGSFAGDRYWNTSLERSEHIGILTSQLLAVRKLQAEEIYSSIF
jgi:hypothetical protein